ncbi:cell division ATP-binding protein FtsE, partial [Candidatus Roizmanbacteria bacterium CG09_land_8_20_14_0_10_41_9]
MITFEKVTKKFPLGNVALEEISFEIKDNEFVFLVGPSGAGKTTILKLILNEYPLTSGSIMVNDFHISSKKFHDVEKLRQKIGMIFQDFKILNDKNIYENVAVSLKIASFPSAYITQAVGEALALVNLSKKAEVFPSQ